MIIYALIGLVIGFLVGWLIHRPAPCNCKPSFALKFGPTREQ